MDGVRAAWLGAVLALSEVLHRSAQNGGCVLARAASESDDHSARRKMEPLVRHLDGAPSLKAHA